MRILLTLFVVVPFVELVLLIAVGQWIGFWNTVLLILVTGVTGAVFAKREGLLAFREFQLSLRRGETPEHALASGLLLLLGGAFLITPGLLTDLAGLFCLVPVTRHWLARQILTRVRTATLAPGSSSFFIEFSQGPWVREPAYPHGAQERARPASRKSSPRPPSRPLVIEAEGEETYRSR